MPSIKTAVSLEKDLFQEVDRLSRRMRISRSRLFGEALREFVDRRRAAELTERMNRAHAVPESNDERDFRRAANWNLARRLKDRW